MRQRAIRQEDDAGRAKVTAIDISEEFIKIAKTKPLADKIDYRVIDVCDVKDLNKLKGTTYDAAVCTMALFDMADIEPLINSIPQLLKDGGKFGVFHPASLFQFGRNHASP